MRKPTREFQTIQHYIQSGAKLHYYGSGEGVHLFVDILARNPLHGFEAPDFYLASDKVFYIIEHFEFSSYRGTRKGDSYRQEEARIQRKADKIIPSEEVTVVHDVIRGESSYSNYMNNVKSTFEAHYAHIDEYVLNLKKAGVLRDQIIKVIFMIEDVSPLGCIAGGKNGWDPDSELITLARSKEFLDLLDKNRNVDYVLACSCYDSNYYTWFIDSNELDVYRANAVDYANMQFIPFEPHVITAKIALKDQ